MLVSEIHWATQAAYPLLTTLQLFPLIAIVILLPLINTSWYFNLALLFCFIELLLGIDMYRHFNLHQPAMQLAEKVTIFGPFSYHVAVDGMSVLFILFTCLLSFLVLFYGMIIPLERPVRLPLIVLAVTSTMISMFVTLDLLWFTLASAIQLSLIAFMIWRWATSPERDLAMVRYIQFMSVSVVLLLIGVGMLGWNHVNLTGHWSFDLSELQQVSISENIRSLIFFLLFYGLAIRVPLFPLHGWLPLVAEHGTVAIAPVFLLGLKLGIYGLLRFVFPLLPEAVLQWHEYVVTIAVAGIFYAAIMALMQVNLRRLLSFAVVSHTSVLIIGLFSLNLVAFQGSILLAINLGMATTGLLFMSGMVFWRTRTLLFSKLGGLFDHLPFISIAFLVSGLSIVGMPGTAGFDAAHLVLEASILRFGALITIAAALGNVVAAGFLLWSFQRVFLATREGGWNAKVISPTSIGEKIMAGIIIFVLVGSSFYSGPMLNLIENSMLGLDLLYSHDGH